jgi:hypothetical protein
MLDKLFHGIVFACTSSTESESFKRLLFGTHRVYAPGAMRVKRGDLLFLLNLDSDLLHGVFRAASDAGINIEPEAWGGRYPYQVRVEPIREIISLRDAKKLLKQLGIRRSIPISGKILTRLLELYRPQGIESKEWFECLSKPRGEIAAEITPKTRKSWELLSDVKALENEFQEDIPVLEATTLWDFSKQNYGRAPKGNNKYPGVTPAALIWNLVWRYTEPGDLIVDPMAGSGTTIDVCREENRRVIGYDIAPVRPDIIQNDARNIPLPDNSVDMIFIDSPYGDNVRYNDHPDCIGKISSETERFYDELEKVPPNTQTWQSSGMAHQ